jgi:hypothetical protein
VAASSKDISSGIKIARSASSIAYSANPPGLAIWFPVVADEVKCKINISKENVWDMDLTSL